MREKQPTITIEELVTDEELRKTEKILDDHLERLFRDSDPKTYTRYKAFMRYCDEGKCTDKSWLIDHWKANWKKYSKQGEQKNRELRLKNPYDKKKTPL